MSSLVYEDAALVVVDKPAGLSSEEGVPAAAASAVGQPPTPTWASSIGWMSARQRPDGLRQNACWPLPALSRQVTQSQEAYAVLDGRAEPDAETPAAPLFRETVPGCPCRRPGRSPPRRGPAAGLSLQGQPQRPGLPGEAARARGCGRPFWNTASPPRPRPKTAPSAWRTSPSTPGGPTRSGCSLPPGSHPLWGDGKYGSRMQRCHCPAVRPPVLSSTPTTGEIDGVSRCRSPRR